MRSRLKFLNWDVGCKVMDNKKKMMLMMALVVVVVVVVVDELLVVSMIDFNVVIFCCFGLFFSLLV